MKPIQGWAVFTPSGVISWRGIETSRQAAIIAFLGYPKIWEQAWEAHQQVGFRVYPVAITALV